MGNCEIAFLHNEFIYATRTGLQHHRSVFCVLKINYTAHGMCIFMEMIKRPHCKTSGTKCQSDRIINLPHKRTSTQNRDHYTATGPRCDKCGRVAADVGKAIRLNSFVCLCFFAEINIQLIT